MGIEDFSPQKRENITPKNELFNHLVEKVKKILPKISPKTLFSIALLSGLSLQEMKAQKIEVPDPSVTPALNQVNQEVDMWKHSLDSKEYRERLLNILGNDAERTDKVIKDRKDNLENSVVYVLTAKSFSDTITKYFDKPYPILGFTKPENKTTFIGTRLGDKKAKTDYVKGDKHRRLMTALYLTGWQRGVSEGTTLHELGHSVESDSSTMLTPEEEDLILSQIPDEVSEKLSASKAKGVKMWKNAIANPYEISPRLGEVLYYFSANGLKQGELTLENTKPLLKYMPYSVQGSYLDLKKIAGMSDESIVLLLNKMPLPFIIPNKRALVDKKSK